MSAALLASCTQKKEEVDQGSARFVATVGSALSAADVAQVTVTVSGDGIGTPIAATLSRSGNTWQGIIPRIPVGADRLFQGSAFDAAGVLIYRGEAHAAITRNNTAVVQVTMQEVNPSPPFVNAAPVIDSIVISAGSAVPGDAITIVVAAHDPNGDALTYAWSASRGTFDDASAAAVTWTAPASDGTDVLSIQVSDPAGLRATASVTLLVADAGAEGAANVIATVNTWPDVTNVSADPTRLDVGESTALEVSAIDNDGDVLDYLWMADCAGSFDDTNDVSPSFTLASLPAGGSCTLTVLVQDGRGGMDTGAVTLATGPAVTPNVAPVIEATTQSQATAGGGDAVTFAVTVRDPEGLAVAFTWSASSGVLSGQSDTLTGSRVLWTSAACGTFSGTPMISVAVRDAAGASTTRTFSVPSTCGGCSDGLLNGDETGIDCGGSCAGCADGVACSQPGDCASNSCVNNLCGTAGCSDGVRNGSETDVDCGGANCQPCPMGDTCMVAVDCVTPPNSVAGCTGGVCGIASCAANFLACDTVLANGCETPFSTTNCGACGNACAAGETCQAGACVRDVWSRIAAVTGTPVSIGISPNNNLTPFTIYVGTAGDGIFSSSNGTTWVSSGPLSVTSLSAQPMQANSFASLPDGTVHTTSNNGATWTQTSGSPNAVIQDWVAIAGVGPLGASSTAGGNAIVYRGVMSGANWTASAPFGTGVGTSIAFGGGASPNAIVFVGVSGSGGGVFVSTNVGSATPTFTSTNFPETQVLSVATAPSSRSTVFAGTNGQGAGLYRSADGGASWTASATGLGNQVVRAIVVEPTNANNVYAGTASGVYVSKDGGATWSLSGLAGSAVTSLAVLNGVPNTVYAATSSGLYVTTTGGL